jgi:hypothetical protein
MENCTEAYLETAIWADGEEVEGADLSPEFVAQATADCEDFLALAGDMVDPDDAGDAGYYFWLTRNGHGAGFWDGDYPEHGDALTDIAKSFGEQYLYLGDNGLVYCS